MNLRQASILVVDDDKDVLTTVRFLLKPEVITIITESNTDRCSVIVTSKKKESFQTCQ